MLMVMMGLMILKKQKGAKARVATPNAPACAAPQEFQGTNTDVTVPASSRVRLKTSGFKF